VLTGLPLCGVPRHAVGYEERRDPTTDRAGGPDNTSSRSDNTCGATDNTSGRTDNTAPHSANTLGGSVNGCDNTGTRGWWFHSTTGEPS